MTINKYPETIPEQNQEVLAYFENFGWAIVTFYADKTQNHFGEYEELPIYWALLPKL